MLEPSVYVPPPPTSYLREWHPWVRCAFRFAFLYWVIYMLPSQAAVSPLHALAPWVGRHIFHLTGEAANWHPTGSSDTAMDYVTLAISVVAALTGALFWSIVGEARAKRKEYWTLYAWLRLILRFTLAVTLLSYGFAKILPAQFGPLSPYGLTETYGDSSPMHLLWTFMGQSRPYMMFGGLMEVVPGVLLLFRRTSTVGLLGAAAVLLNVVMLNFSYDVPVKLYSGHLLLMSLFLLLPDARPIWNFLVERKEASLTGVWVPRFERKPLRIGAHVLQGLVVVGALIFVIWTSYAETQTRANVGPLQGVYAVDAVKGFGTDARWTQAFFDDRYGQHYFGLIGPDKKPIKFPVTYDLTTQTMRINDEKSAASFQWSKDASGELNFVGAFRGETASLHLRQTSPETFALNTRGFHWVTEDSYNH